MPLGENSANRSEPLWFAKRMLGWYDHARRDLPWRCAPGVKADPYKVWLSEIMLQQTTVKAVASFYADFLESWPTVEEMACAQLDEVLSAWAGLGYYARARNLHACAKAVVNDFGGSFPETENELLKLPGIGPYTAAAISAIAFDRKAAVVDGNVERVLSRFCAVKEPLPNSKKFLRGIAQALAPSKRPGDFAQAMMDLGATVCTPRQPSCSICPLERKCTGRALGLETTLPNRVSKTAKPTRQGTVFFVVRSDNAILLRKRHLKGLLGGMTEVPATPWADSKEPENSPDDHAPLDANWLEMPGTVRHTFTHFHLELAVFGARVDKTVPLKEVARPDACQWVFPEEIASQPLPSVMRKVLDHALRHMKEPTK